MLLTTSWDDGYKLDLKVAQLLERYGFTGTFYVCPRKQHDKEMLTEDDIRLLSEKHEIGAHTLRHPKLPEISILEAKSEIAESKAWVEQTTDKPCTMFCYPYGMYNDKIQELVEGAGFVGARTTERMQFSYTDPYAIPTTVQVTPFPKRKTCSRWWHPLDIYAPRRIRSTALRKLGIKPTSVKTWLSLATTILDKALELEKSSQLSALSSQLSFHLWGHSHEIEKYNMWGELEQFLAYAKEKGVEGVTNSDILQ